jgi:ferritin-like metal-binding protein YciE
MPGDDIQEQVVKYLTDVHSTEENAINQLKTGAESVEDERLAQVLRQHLAEIAIQTFAFEHLEIASYRSLRTVAERAGDQETVQLAERILADERATADKLDALLEEAALVGLPQTASA